MKIFELFYSKIKKPKKISIFDNDFVNINKHRYKIIYENKIYPLQDALKIEEKQKNELKIKLICYNNIFDIQKVKKEYDSYRFYENSKYKKKY